MKNAVRENRWLLDSGSIRTQLLGTSVVLVLFPAVLIGSVTAWVGAKSGLQQIYSQLDSVADLKEQSIVTWRDSLHSDLNNALASENLRWHATVLLQKGESLDLFREASLNRVDSELRKYLLKTRHFDELFLLDLDGRVVFSTQAEKIGTSHRSSEFFRKGKQDFFVSEPKSLAPSHAFSLFVGLPASNGGGQLMGVLAGRASLSQVNEAMLSRRGLGETGETYLVSRAGVLLTQIRDAGHTRVGQVIPRLGGEPGAEEHIRSRHDNYAGVPVVGVRHWIADLKVSLVAEMQQSEAFAPTYTVIKISALVVLVSILIALTIGVILTRKLTAPLASLSTAASTIATGDTAYEVARQGSTEVKQLVSAFNAMVARIDGLLKDVRHTEQQQRDLLNNTTSVIYMKYPDGRYFFVNRTFEALFEVSNEAINGRTAHDIFPKNQADSIFENDLEVLESGRLIEFEERVSHKDGERVYISVKFPLFDESGQVYAISGISTDITDRKRAQEERERLMLAIEQATEAVVIADVHGIIQYANRAFTDITGHSHQEAVSRDLSIFEGGKSGDAPYDDMRDSIKAGDTWSGRLVSLRKDGSQFTEDTTISPVRDALGETINFVAVKRDVTHEVELEHQLRESQKMEAVGQLAGGIAHDFNNLLHVILGYCAIAMSRLESEHPAFHYIEQVNEAGRRSAALVQQLLAYSRQQVLNMTDVDLDDLILNVMKMIRRVIGEHIALKIVTSQSPGVIRADPGQIEQILMNLCVNARDAMPDGGTITIKTELIHIAESSSESYPSARPGPHVQVSVTDSGTGMTDETIASIFEPFFTTKDVGEGTGLGLATVHGIVMQHRGLINVSSELGEGTTFQVCFPLQERVSDQAELSQAQVDGPGGTETVLIAEDDDAVRQLAVAMLEGAGYHVLTAVDGEDAVRVYEHARGSVDLVVLDVMMPNAGGYAAYDQIQKEHGDVPVLFASGYNMQSVSDTFQPREGLQLIQKPYAALKLLNKVREVLDA